MVVNSNIFVHVFWGRDLEHSAEISVGRELPFLKEPLLCAGVDGAVDGFGGPYESSLGYGDNEEKGEVDETNGGDVYLMEPAGADDELEW